MKLIDKLNQDFSAGRFDNGFRLKIHYRADGNIYNYLIGDELYQSLHQCSRSLAVLERFLIEHDIKVTEIDKKPPPPKFRGLFFCPNSSRR